MFIVVEGPCVTPGIGQCVSSDATVTALGGLCTITLSRNSSVVLVDFTNVISVPLYTFANGTNTTFNQSALVLGANFGAGTADTFIVDFAPNSSFTFCVSARGCMARVMR
jgi:hypothetical protein